MYRFSGVASDDASTRAPAFAPPPTRPSAKGYGETPAGKPSPEFRTASTDQYSVVWWDPHILALDADAGYGLRRDDLIVKDGKPADVAARLAEYRAWQAARRAAQAAGRTPSLHVRTATAAAVDREFDHPGAPEVRVVAISRSTERPFGARFGALVHATLATVPLDASESTIAAVAAAQGRILPSPDTQQYADEEVYAACEVVTAVLRDRLFDRVRVADRSGQCERELPIMWTSPDGTLIEGTIDLAFEDAGGLTVVDFKTDRELSTDLERYERQLRMYCMALATARGKPATGILMRI
jgi:ATP-dependent exoDNAse (exonuclease V) beta subunit